MPKNRTSNIFIRTTAWLASSRFFTLIIAVLILQALWIALSGRYPMAFDEDFHLGIIRLYADHISPFWSLQPVSADTYGAITRDPSYLYHWLMSFPYRLINLFTNNQTAQVITLRVINIALFAAALPLYRLLLLKTGASRALVNSSLAVLVLIPIVPLLAAQINYDNLFLPLTALVLLIAIKVSEEMKHTQRLNVCLLIVLTVLLMLTSLVKYAFLPLAMIVAVFLVVRCYQTYRTWQKLRLSVGFGISLIDRGTRWLLLACLVIVSGLFIQRYGVNIALYHKPVPDCSQVLSVDRCKSYSPWLRDYILETNKDGSDGAITDPIEFTARWFYGMWFRSFFAVDGPGSNFTTRGPLTLPGWSAIILMSVGVISAVVYAKRLFRRYNPRVLGFFVAVITGYAAVLWLDGYQSFMQTGQAVAINGRYLLPVMPLLILITGLGLSELLRRRQKLKLILAATAFICLICGGGALTYILRSDNSWYWHNQAVYDANQGVRRVLGPLTPGYDHPTSFMGWN